MELRSVNSSNIAQIGFDERKVISMNQKPKNVLRVIFKNGNIYDYYDIEKQLYLDFLHSNSKGKFFWNHIKDKYNYEKIK